MLTVFTFYTPEYASFARRLSDSLVKHDTRFAAYPQELQGLTWRQRCAFKARFCRIVRDSYKGQLLWIDADAEVCGSLEALSAFSEEQCDIVVHRPDRAKYPLINSRLMSGTILMNDTGGCRIALSAWEAAAAASGHIKYDQEILEDVLQSLGSRVRVGQLPAKYIAVDLMPDIFPTATIKHHQASRTLKDKIDSLASR